MPNAINAIPEFSGSDSAEVVTPNVEETTENQQQESGSSPEQATTDPGQEVVEEEKETPSEPSADEQPTGESETPASDDTSDTQGLLTERERLLKEIKELRTTRRKEREISSKAVEEHIDDLKDIHPDDMKVFERIMRAKGVITREQANQMFYDAVKDEEINKFLEEFPEYKPENDLSDLNWTMLQDRVLTFFRMPENPHKIRDVLKMAHQTIARVTPSDSSTRQVQIKQQQRKIASAGAGGVQRSSTTKTLDPEKRHALLMGGWSEEDIKRIETKL